MKATTIQTVGFVMGILGVIGMFFKPNLGFVAITGAESLGFNFGNLLFPILGLLIYRYGRNKAKKESLEKFEGNK